mmetsp:Transcript_12112/g.15131  ORF Transcript_12112/g.15131 Transcript_12112/m.15131 type:complete len:359 (-) Transcript_12112:35-1111(-)
MFKGLIISLLVGIALSQDELTPSSFDSVVDGSKNVFVMFYAPWCRHCKNFKPEYAKAAESFKDEDSVVVASVDADKYKDLGSKYDVSGFPTLKFFPKGSTKPEDYSSGRTADAVVKFINGKAGTSVEVKEPPSLVTKLTSSNFDEIALGGKNVLVEFYAPWCGHCKQLAPTYEQVAGAFEQEDSVVIAKVDATEEGDLASKYGVSGYPTLKYFPAGKKDAVDYKGGRSLKNFVDYINDQAGTRRKEDGTLARAAGRIPELDTIANDIYNDKKSLSDLQTACKGYSTDECKYYIKYTNKISDKGKEYVTKERDRLAKTSKSSSIKKDKRDNMIIRMNVLNGFLEGPEFMDDKSKDKEEL